MASWTNYKTLTGGNVVKTRTPDPTGAAGLVINDNFKAMANALESVAARAGTKIYYGQIAGTSGGSGAALAGDYFLDTDDGNLYTLVGTVWTLVTCIQGTNGINGTDGTDGVGYIAAAINAAGELVLTKSDNSTVNVGAVKGAPGAAGPAGATGAQGPQGATGAQGPAGSCDWTTVTNATAAPSLTLADSTVVNLTNSALTTISLDLADGATMARVMFLSGASAPSIDDPVDSSSNPLWTWIGDGCSDGVFSPSATTEYDLIIESTPRGVIATAKGWK